jgi:hypothetical protein
MHLPVYKHALTLLAPPIKLQTRLSSAASTTTARHGQGTNYGWLATGPCGQHSCCNRCIPHNTTTPQQTQTDCCHAFESTEHSGRRTAAQTQHSAMNSSFIW